MNRTSYSKRLALALGTTVALLGLAPLAASPAGAVRPSGPAPLVLPAPVLPKGDHIVSGLPSSKALSFDLVLQIRHQSQLSAFLAAVTNKKSPMFRHFLSRGAFAADFGASSAQLATVTSTLQSDGLAVSNVSSNHLLVSVHTTVAKASALFHTAMASVRLSDGTPGWMTTRPVVVPSSLSSLVTGVVGLDNLISMSNAMTVPHLVRPLVLGHTHVTGTLRPRAAAGAPTACASATYATQQGYGGITQNQIATAYGINGLYQSNDYGRGQTIAVFELEPYQKSDIQSFEQCYFGADNTSQISNVTVDGGSGTGMGSGEAALDVENLVALAPAASIKVYTGPNTTYGSLDTYNRIVADDTASIVSTSWGQCEAAMQTAAPGTLVAEHLIFEEAAAQGQSVFAAAGDNGNDDCAGHASTPTTPLLSVDDPASQPYVIGVGGTTPVGANGLSPNPTQKVWNDGSTGGAGGGGISMLWAQPSWMAQSYDTTNGSTCGLTVACRTVPDVSAFADEYDGVTLYWNDQWGTIGGTSSAAPQWAAMLAEINASPTCAASPTTANGVGFVAPLLYNAATTDYATAFTDITQGNNDVFNANNLGYQASAGYDMASGLGSPNLTPYTGAGGAGLASNVCSAAQGSGALTISSVSPSVVTVAGGQTLTITGLGFGTHASPRVSQVMFGATPSTAPVNVVNNTTLTVVSPALSSKSTVESVLSVSGSTTSDVVTLLGTSQNVSFAPPSGQVTVHVDATNGAPAVLQVGPTGGITNGGNTVAIYGTGFTGATAVTFGGVRATYTVVNDNQISAVAPAAAHAHCAPEPYPDMGLCQVQVVVTSANGTPSVQAAILPPLTGVLSTNAEGLFQTTPGCGCEFAPSATEYDYSSPTISQVINVKTGQASGSPNGGESVQITGTGLNVLTMNWINWGDATLNTSITTSLTFFSPDGHVIALTAPQQATPSATPTSVPVSINFEGGNTNTLQWTYGASPYVTGVSTSVLPAAGSGNFTVYGNFSNLSSSISSVELVPTQVSGTPLVAIQPSDFTVGNSSIVVKDPSAVPGNYVVEVCTKDGICNGAQNESTDPAQDCVIVANPGDEVVTSLSDPSQAPGTPTITPSSTDDLVLTGQNLSPANDQIVYMSGAGDIVGTATVLSANGTSQYTLAPPSLGNGTAPGMIYVLIFNGNNATAANIAAAFNYSFAP